MQSRWALSPSRVAGSVAPATITLSSRLWWSHANFGGEGRAVLPANVREFAVLGINSAPDCIISFMPTTVLQTPTDRPALRASGLHKVYGSVTALDGVSFTVNRGEIVGLLGPNGAGKTTTINMVLGVLAATTGSVEIDGIDISKQRARALAKTNFAAVYAALPGNLTVIENLRFFGLLYGVDSLRIRVEELLRQFDLAHLRQTKCGLLSSGEQTRAALAKALLNKPQLLLLDEPTASLDPSAAQLIRAKIKSLAIRGPCRMNMARRPWRISSFAWRASRWRPLRRWRHDAAAHCRHRVAADLPAARQPGARVSHGDLGGHRHCAVGIHHPLSQYRERQRGGLRTHVVGRRALVGF